MKTAGPAPGPAIADAMRASHPRLPAGRRRQQGLGIIEVLVAVVVVSFGVLGMASLQLTGMKHSTGGYHRAKALLLAEDMATRLRINTPAVKTSVAADQAYANRDSNLPSFSCTSKPIPWCQAESTALTVPRCSPAQLADFDFFAVACGDWGSDGARLGATGSLPDGRLQVSCVPASAGGDCAADALYQVEVSWNEGSTTKLDADEIKTRSVRMRLRP